jgi:hypothetical protein
LGLPEKRHDRCIRRTVEESTDDTELSAPAQDIHLRETQHILTDYLQLLDRRPAVTPRR